MTSYDAAQKEANTLEGSLTWRTLGKDLGGGVMSDGPL
jgi:hypothetical protein